MHEHVYFHKTTRGFERLLTVVFERAKELARDSKIDFVTPALDRILADPTDLQAFLELDEHVLWTQIRVWQSAEDATLARLCGYLLDRKPYTLGWEAINDRILTTDESVALIKRIESHDLDPRYDFFEDSPKLDPYKDPYLLGKGTHENVWLSENGELTELAEESVVVKALRNNPVQHYRAYVSPAYVEKEESTSAI